MREILFRGKRVDNGEWVCGMNIMQFKLAVDSPPTRAFITPENSKIKTFNNNQNDDVMVNIPTCQVIPETVGQYTGLTDKNGKKVFEGDILLERNCVVWEEYEKADGSKWRKTTNKKEDRRYTVRFDEKTAQFTTDLCWLYALRDSVEVIGSIHDKEEV